MPDAERLVSEFLREHPLTDEEAEALAEFGGLVEPDPWERPEEYLKRILRLWVRARLRA